MPLLNTTQVCPKPLAIDLATSFELVEPPSDLDLLVLAKPLLVAPTNVSSKTKAIDRMIDCFMRKDRGGYRLLSAITLEMTLTVLGHSKSECCGIRITRDWPNGI